MWPAPRRPRPTPAEIATQEHLLILEAERKQEQAQARLMNLEVIRRALLLAGAILGIAWLLLRLLTEIHFPLT
jgi:hypothetical protein